MINNTNNSTTSAATSRKCGTTASAATSQAQTSRAATTPPAATTTPTPEPEVLKGLEANTHIKAYKSFEHMPLHNNLLRGVYSFGFEKPSPIQSLSIVPMSKGGDIIAQAQSGTGKTGAFAIGLLQRMDLRHKGMYQGLVLSPTRELADQTYKAISNLGAFLSPGEDDAKVSWCHYFVGGTPIVAQLNLVKTNTGVVAVGTPGRVADLIRKGALRTQHLKTIVLDEADEMLSQGFEKEVAEIFKYLPRDIQVALFSATLPDNVLALTDKLMRDPTRILVDAQSLTLEGIKQFYVAVEEDYKFLTLTDLYECISISQSVIFAKSRDKVNWIAQQMNQAGHTVSYLHADMPKGERAKVMDQFRSGSSRVLVTTDLVARGIDVQHVNVVINFDMPYTAETYLHRIGRSGRYGRKGIAINFVANNDTELFRAVENHYKISIDELPEDFITYLSQ
jgi:translation initiation factor 4A